MAASNLIQALIIIHACEARAKFGAEKAEEIARMVGELASYLPSTCARSDPRGPRGGIKRRSFAHWLVNLRSLDGDDAISLEA